MPSVCPAPVSGTDAAFTVPAALAGMRLDRALAELVPDLSRARARRLIAAEGITLNGTPTKPSHKVERGDVVHVGSLTVEHPTAPAPEPIPLDVVYEDDAVLVLNKPAGLVVHPAVGHERGTLVHALLHHTAGTITGAGPPDRPGIVHRLDRFTSGVMVVAKTAAAHAALAPQFAAHTVHREYVALVWGRFTERKGTIEAPIGRSTADRKKMAVAGLNCRAARTRFTMAAVFPDVTELRLRLDTGRTHQVRVHCAYIGHGVVGDPTYGSPPGRRSLPWPGALWDQVRALPGQMLHAATLGFTHPVTDAWVQWEAPPPPAYTALRAALAALPDA